MMHLEALYWVVSDNTNDSLFKYISIKYYNTDFMAFTCVLDVSIVGIGIGLVAARPSCSNIFSKLFFAKQPCFEFLPCWTAALVSVKWSKCGQHLRQTQQANKYKKNNPYLRQPIFYIQAIASYRVRFLKCRVVRKHLKQSQEKHKHEKF